MRVRVSGISVSEYTDKSTGIVKRSKTIYYQKLDNDENVDGLATGSEYISGNSPFYDSPVKVGQTLNLLYERVVYGRNERAVLAAVLDENMRPLK